MAALFSAFQLIPHLFQGDTAVTGEGASLRSTCSMRGSSAREAGSSRTAAGPVARATLVNGASDVRTRCDPIVIAAQAGRLCGLLEKRPVPTTLDVAVDAKRSTDDAMQPLIHVDDFCHKAIAYSPWGHNAWIGGPQGR